MNTKHILTAFAALSLFCACSNNDETLPQEGMPILLTSVVDGCQTRAGSNIQSSMLAQGEKVNVYITAPNGGATYEPKVYKINANGEMAPVGNIFPYFPSNGNSVDIYAIYPSAVTRDNVDFTVSSNQDKQAQYKASDLMYGTVLDTDGNRTTVAPIDVKQTITFKHKLSKVTVVLASGTGSPVIKNSEIQLCNVYQTIGFTPSSGALGSLSGDPDYVTMTTNGQNSVSAIIPPQEIGTGYFLKIRLSGGDIIYYSPAQSFNVESGKEYKFNVTINQNSLSVNYTVSDWQNTKDELGNDNNVYTGQTAFGE